MVTIIRAIAPTFSYLNVTFVLLLYLVYFVLTPYLQNLILLAGKDLITGVFTRDKYHTFRYVRKLYLWFPFSVACGAHNDH